VKIFVHPGATHGFSHRTAVAYDASAEQAGMASVRELVRALG
jgi:dienelactone hydrolase